MKILFRGLLAAACASALAAPVADAAPVTINLRIEGKTRTLYEGPVTSDVRTFRYSDSTTEYQCDGTTVGGTSPTPTVTRGAILTTAMLATPFSSKGVWYDSFGPSFTEIVGENVSYGNDGSDNYLVEFKNWKGTDLGACGDVVQNGDEALFAWAGFGSSALKLTGPATAKPGQAFALKVTDGDGAAISGATVGGATTDGSGTATVTSTARGPQSFKAEKPGIVRSNAVSVCVTDGADGYCGTTSPTGQTGLGGGGGTTTTGGSTPFVRDVFPPQASIAGIKQGQRIKRSKAPQLLKGSVDENGGVLMVKLRLTRTTPGGRCMAYSGKRERFIARDKCGAQSGWWFKIGDRADWEYQLSRKLGAGRYVLDVNVIDKAYNRDDERRSGENRVVFTVL